MALSEISSKRPFKSFSRLWNNVTVMKSWILWIKRYLCTNWSPNSDVQFVRSTQLWYRNRSKSLYEISLMAWNILLSMRSRAGNFVVVLSWEFPSTCLEFGNEPTNQMSANMFGELMTKSRWVAGLNLFEKWEKYFKNLISFILECVHYEVIDHVTITDQLKI